MNTPVQIQAILRQVKPNYSIKAKQKEELVEEEDFKINGVSIKVFSHANHHTIQTSESFYLIQFISYYEKQVEEILQKSSQNRTEGDLNLLKSYTKDFSIFKKYNKDKSIQQNIQYKCLKYMKVLAKPKNQHIFTDNEKTKTRLYFILKGSISIYQQTNHVSRRSSLISLPTRRNSFLNIQSTKKLENLQQSFQTPKSENQKQIQQIQNSSVNINQVYIDSDNNHQLSQSLILPQNKQIDTFTDILRVVEDYKVQPGNGDNTIINNQNITPKAGSQNKSRFYKSEQRPSLTGGVGLSKFNQVQNESNYLLVDHSEEQLEKSQLKDQEQPSGDQTVISSKKSKKSKKQNKDQYKLAEQMTIFIAGQTFGKEISDQNYQHNMYACCEEDSVLGYLDQKDYKNILELEEERLLLRKCQKLRRYKILSNCSNEQLKQLIKNMTTLTIIKKQNLYQEGDFSEFVYLFQKGQIIIKKKIVVNETEIEDPWRENEKLIAMRMFQQKSIELAELYPYDLIGVDEIFNSQQRDLDMYHQAAQAQQTSPTLENPLQEEEQEIIHDRYLSLVINSETAIFKVIKKDFFKSFAKNNNLISDLYKKSEENQSWINKLVLNYQSVYSLKKQYMIQIKQGDRDPQLAVIENHLNEKQKKENIKQVFFLIRPEIQTYQRIKRVRAQSESESDKRIRKIQDDLSKPMTVEQNFQLHKQLIKFFTKKKQVLNNKQHITISNQFNRKETNEKELRVNLFVNSSVKLYRDRESQRRTNKQYQSTGGIKTNQKLDQSSSPKNKQSPINKQTPSPKNKQIKNNILQNRYHSLHNQKDRDHHIDNSFSQQQYQQNSSRGDNSLIQLYKNQERAYTPSVTGRLNLSHHKSPLHNKRPSSNTGKNSHLNNQNLDYILCSDLIQEDKGNNSNLKQFQQLIRGSINQKIEEGVGDFTSAIMFNDQKINTQIQNQSKQNYIDFKTLLQNKKIKNILSQIYDTSTVNTNEQQNMKNNGQQYYSNNEVQTNIPTDQSKRIQRSKSSITQGSEQYQDYEKNYLPTVTTVPEEFYSQKQSMVQEQNQNYLVKQTNERQVKITSQNLQIPLLNSVEKKQESKMRSQLIMKQLDLIKQKTMMEKIKNKSKDTVFNSISICDIQRSIRDDSIEKNKKIQSNLDKLLNYFDHQQIKKSSPQNKQENSKRDTSNKISPQIKTLKRDTTQNSLQNVINEFTLQQQQQFKMIEKICPPNPMVPLTKLKQQKYIKIKK